MPGLRVEIWNDSVKKKSKCTKTEPKSHLPGLSKMSKIRDIQVFEVAHVLRCPGIVLNWTGFNVGKDGVP